MKKKCEREEGAFAATPLPWTWTKAVVNRREAFYLRRAIQPLWAPPTLRWATIINAALTLFNPSFLCRESPLEAF